jgi:hypothetical protein
MKSDRAPISMTKTALENAKKNSAFIHLLPGTDINNAYLLPETQICPVILHQRN